MSTVEIEAINDARRYSERCEEGERESAMQYRRGMQINKVCEAIRACELDMDGIRQVLSTLACAAHDQSMNMHITDSIESTLKDLE